jgi:hypothetical protein
VAPSAAVIGDFNGDGKKDIAGTGAFAAAVNVPTGSSRNNFNIKFTSRDSIIDC